MKQQLNARMIWGIVGMLLVPATIGIGVYFLFFATKVPAVASTKTSYDTSFITSMKEADLTKNVYSRTGLLKQVAASTDQNTQYQPSDLGKTDVTQIGK